MQTTAIQDSTLDEAAQVLSLATVHLRQHPEWSLPLIEIVTGRLFGDPALEAQISPALVEFLATGNMAAEMLESLDAEITALWTRWIERLRGERDGRFSAGDAQGALAIGQKLSRQAVSVREDILVLAHLFAHTGQLEDAKRLAESVPDRETDGDLQRFRASIFERLGQFDEALIAARSAMNICVDGSAVKEDLERIFSKRRDQLAAVRANASLDAQERLAAAMELIHVEPGVDSITALVHLQGHLGLLDEALETVDQLLALDRTNGQIFRLKASLLERQGRLAEALTEATQAGVLLPDDPEVKQDQWRIGMARREELTRLRDATFPDGASLEAARQLHQLGHSSAEDDARFAHIQTHHGLLQQALATIDSAIQKNSADSEFHRLRSSLLERLGIFDAGLASAKQAMRLAPGDKSLKTDLRRLRAKVICSRILRA